MPAADHKAEVQARFGAHASAYLTSPSHAQGASLGRLVALVAPAASDLVLDIATGAGHNALAFAPHVRHVVCCDLTPQMLAAARRLAGQRGIRQVSFCQGDAEHLPFADGSFAVVTCRIAPHHFPEVARAVQEMTRVCAAGGCVAIVDNITPADAAAAAYINDFEARRDPSHHWACSLPEWHQMFARAGLTLEAEEILAKGMEFVSWAIRLGAAEEVVEELRQLLFTAPDLVRAFLRPRVEGQEVYFDLTEALLIGRKSPSAERPRAGRRGSGPATG